MSIYKTLIIGTKIKKVTHPGTDWTYDEESRAYSDYQFFSTLEKAKAFCEQYIRPVIDFEDTDEPPVFTVNWEHVSDDCWTTDFGIYNFNIYMELNGEMDTLSMPPLPTKFAEHRHPGD